MPEVNLDCLISLSQQIRNWEDTYRLSAIRSDPQAFAAEKIFNFNSQLRRRLLDYTRAMFERRRLENALRISYDIEYSFRTTLKLPWKPEEHKILEEARSKTIESRMVLAAIVGCIEGIVNSWRGIGYAETTVLLKQVSGVFYFP